MNYYVLLIFAPLLFITGVLGFIIPKEKSLTSGAAPYNIFHIVFGAVGLIFVLINDQVLIRSFNFGFGLIDLYQFVASYLNLFPKQEFEWKKADDILHLVIGIFLVGVAVLGN